jgi:hypothetical protein
MTEGSGGDLWRVCSVVWQEFQLCSLGIFHQWLAWAPPSLTTTCATCVESVCGVRLGVSGSIAANTTARCRMTTCKLTTCSDYKTVFLGYDCRQPPAQLIQPTCPNQEGPFSCLLAADQLQSQFPGSSCHCNLQLGLIGPWPNQLIDQLIN